MKKRRGRRSLLRLRKWLVENDIEPLEFLKALFRGDAPPVVIFGDELYLDDADESRWRMKLGAEASRRSFDIAARVIADAQ